MRTLGPLPTPARWRGGGGMGRWDPPPHQVTCIPFPLTDCGGGGGRGAEKVPPFLICLEKFAHVAFLKIEKLLCHWRIHWAIEKLMCHLRCPFFEKRIFVFMKSCCNVKVLQYVLFRKKWEVARFFLWPQELNADVVKMDHSPTPPDGWRGGGGDE